MSCFLFCSISFRHKNPDTCSAVSEQGTAARSCWGEKNSRAEESTWIQSILLRGVIEFCLEAFPTVAINNADFLQAMHTLFERSPESYKDKFGNHAGCEVAQNDRCYRGLIEDKVHDILSKSIWMHSTQQKGSISVESCGSAVERLWDVSSGNRNMSCQI